MGRTASTGHTPAVGSSRRGWIPALGRYAPCDGEGKARVGRRHIYILPTGAGVLFGGICLVMLLGSLNYQNNLALAFSFLTISVGLVGMHHTWLNLLGLQLGVRGGAPVFAGQDALFILSLYGDHSRPRREVSVAAPNARNLLVRLEPAEAAAGNIRIPTLKRGICDLNRVKLETRYPLGLFRAWCYAQTNAHVTVYPHPAPRSPEPPAVPTSRHDPLGDRGVGADDYVGTRGYRHGDPLRRLDWKALARQRGLQVKQFGGDRAGRVWLDWNRLPAMDSESKLSVLCRQVLDAAERGSDYGLRLPGETVPMGRGAAHSHRCLTALAEFDHG